MWLDEAAKLDPETQAAPGVTMADMLALHTRPPDPEGAVFAYGVEYARVGERVLKLSVYAREDPSEHAPAAVFIHGGGWHGGDPYFHIRHAHGLAARGYATAVVEYRLGLEAPWPAALEDCEAAVRWLRANASSIGADPDRIGVAGGSAGGHLAALVALTGRDDPTRAVQAAVLWYPATDLVGFAEGSGELHPVVTGYFGDERANASPINHVHAGAPPVLTITGSVDALVSVERLQLFHEKLDAVGVANRLVVFEGREHGFDLFPRDWQASFDVMAAFLDETLRPPATGTT